MKLRFCLFVCVVVLLFSCAKDNAFDCFKAKGKTVSETRYPGAFSKLTAYSKIEVTVFKGTEHKVEVIAGQNLLKNIHTHVIDNELKIEDLNTCNFVRGYKHRIKVYVTTPYVSLAANEGVSLLKFNEGFE